MTDIVREGRDLARRYHEGRGGPTGKQIDLLCDKIEEQAATIERLRAALQWQPMETAPKTGQRLLVLRHTEKGYEHLAIGIDRWMRGTWWHSRQAMQPIAWMSASALLPKEAANFPKEVKDAIEEKFANPPDIPSVDIFAREALEKNDG